MSKAPLYSRSPRRSGVAPGTAAATAEPAAGSGQPEAAAATDTTRAEAPARSRTAGLLQRHRTTLAVLMAVLLTASAMFAWQRLAGSRGLVVTQADIDRAVRESLEKEPLPSEESKAYAAILPSVVRVIGLLDESDTGESNAEQRALERSLGSGVVIVDNGTILTNLHVVWGARKVMVVFANGHRSEASIVGAQPENDLAVLKAQSLPDDLEAATMRSTGDLQPGDKVIAVGHPFGIGPSVSAGVVSGLKRSFRSPDGEKILGNLIQFDAAANPGNSGGPLVTMDGHVVGIVTAILNPSEQRTFIGIGFAVPIENAAAAAGMPPF
jgi:S1-C subfamily serine protease